MSYFFPFLGFLFLALSCLAVPSQVLGQTASPVDPSTTPTSCCSEGAWGELQADDAYVNQGVVDRVGDLDIYRVGNASKTIIWNYDIFGFDIGRTKQLADRTADKGNKLRFLFSKIQVLKYTENKTRMIKCKL